MSDDVMIKMLDQEVVSLNPVRSTFVYAVTLS